MVSGFGEESGDVVVGGRPNSVRTRMISLIVQQPQVTNSSRERESQPQSVQQLCALTTGPVAAGKREREREMEEIS